MILNTFKANLRIEAAKLWFKYFWGRFKNEGRAFALPNAFHYSLAAFPILTHHCAVAELKNKKKQMNS